MNPYTELAINMRMLISSYDYVSDDIKGSNNQLRLLMNYAKLITTVAINHINMVNNSGLKKIISHIIISHISGVGRVVIDRINTTPLQNKYLAIFFDIFFEHVIRHDILDSYVFVCSYEYIDKMFLMNKFDSQDDKIIEIFTNFMQSVIIKQT